MGPIIDIGGEDYRVDDLIALLEEVIHNSEETDEQMDLYLEYKRDGIKAFMRPKHKKTLALLLEGEY